MSLSRSRQEYQYLYRLRCPVSLHLVRVALLPARVSALPATPCASGLTTCESFRTSGYTLCEYPYCLRECPPFLLHLVRVFLHRGTRCPAKCRFNVVLRYTFSAYRAKVSKGVRWMLQYKTTAGLTWCCFTSARQYVTCMRICYSDSISSIGSSRISAIISTLISVALSFLA